MRHSYFGRKLSRTTNERQQLFRNLLRALIAHGTITTTIARAKAIQPAMEKLITKAKVGEHKKREIFAALGDKDATREIVEMGKIRFEKRSSGFTRIIKLGLRPGDAAEMVQLSFVDQPVAIVPTEIVSTKKKAILKKPKKEEKSKKPKRKTAK